LPQAENIWLLSKGQRRKWTLFVGKDFHRSEMSYKGMNLKHLDTLTFLQCLEKS